ncbi:YolD-like family protein [Paenibacillaceae bacterium]|nr:YolD-like family protein [Paenibacillaceae bacterium]
MRKKLEGNGLWESSRMMLPEHKEASIRNRKEMHRRKRTDIDDQELEQFGRAIAESRELGKEVIIQLFDEWEQLQVIGIVERIDHYQRRFMMDGEWFWLVDVEGVETSKSPHGES